MSYAMQILEKRRRDHVAAANAIERRAAGREGPGWDEEAGAARRHRVKAEELERALGVLSDNKEDL